MSEVDFNPDNSKSLAERKVVTEAVGFVGNAFHVQVIEDIQADPVDFFSLSQEYRDVPEKKWEDISQPLQDVLSESATLVNTLKLYLKKGGKFIPVTSEDKTETGFSIPGTEINIDGDTIYDTTATFLTALSELVLSVETFS